MKKEKRQYAVLRHDWSYTNMLGEKVIFKKGRRFKLSETTFFIMDNLVLLHWYGYGQSEMIEAKYFRK